MVAQLTNSLKGMQSSVLSNNCFGLSCSGFNCAMTEGVAIRGGIEAGLSVST